LSKAAPQFAAAISREDLRAIKPSSGWFAVKVELPESSDLPLRGPMETDLLPLTMNDQFGGADEFVISKSS